MERRLWRVLVSEGGVFSAESDSLIGGARGLIRGNALEMRYTMCVATPGGGDMRFDFHDFMFLQPDGSLHNMTHVKKWGVRVGTVATQYARHGGRGAVRHAPPARRSPVAAGAVRSPRPNERSARSPRSESRRLVELSGEAFGHPLAQRPLAATPRRRVDVEGAQQLRHARARANPAEAVQGGAGIGQAALVVREAP